MNNLLKIILGPGIHSQELWIDCPCRGCHQGLHGFFEGTGKGDLA